MQQFKSQVNKKGKVISELKYYLLFYSKIDKSKRGLTGLILSLEISRTRKQFLIHK